MTEDEKQAAMIRQRDQESNQRMDAYNAQIAREQGLTPSNHGIGANSLVATLAMKALLP